MKVRIIDLEPGDIIYDFGEYLRVDSISIIDNCAYCTNLYTKKFSSVSNKLVKLCYRQLTLF